MLTLLPWILFTAFLIPQAELPGSWLGRFKLAEEALDAGACDEAVHYLESCLELVLENATTACHLACAHARTGHAEAALAWLEKAVDWGWADAAMMLWDKDLEPLRGTEKFEELTARAKEAKDAPDQSMRLVEPFRELESWRSPSISPDGQRLLANRSLWDVRTGEYLAKLSDGEGELDHSFFDPSGEYIVTISKKEIRIWNGRDG
ncbi:MAG: WD40 repeat domain-containing protein, partial [Planctomycetota bacterium]